MHIETFQIIGISVRTTNENGQSGQDIPQLWQRFFAENIMEKIPNRQGNSIYSVYTDYESDFTKPYTTILGCLVRDLQHIPEGMVGKTVQGGKFAQFTAKGRDAVFPEWLKIWKSNLDRRYSADFEVYGEKSQHPEHPEIDIFISVKET